MSRTSASEGLRAIYREKGRMEVEGKREGWSGGEGEQVKQRGEIPNRL